MKFLVLFLGLLGLELFSTSGPEFGFTFDEFGVYWQGDIFLNERQKQILSGNANMTVTGLFDLLNRWPASNTGLLDLSIRWPKIAGYVWVPYMFDTGNFSEADKALIRKDLRTIEKKTCVRFQPLTNQTNYVRIINGYGCWSHLGMQGGEQIVSLRNPFCVLSGTVIHMFIHTLGYTHMQNRIDRDQFVTIYFERIASFFSFVFDKFDAKDNFNTTYDYESVMHYKSTAYSNFNSDSNDTIVPTNRSYIDVIGQRQISYGDIERINHMYAC